MEMVSTAFALRSTLAALTKIDKRNISVDPSYGALQENKSKMHALDVVAAVTSTHMTYTL